VTYAELQPPGGMHDDLGATRIRVRNREPDCFLLRKARCLGTKLSPSIEAISVHM
jgi:hypothetical protein